MRRGVIVHRLIKTIYIKFFGQTADNFKAPILDEGWGCLVHVVRDFLLVHYSAQKNRRSYFQCSLEFRYGICQQRSFQREAPIKLYVIFGDEILIDSTLNEVVLCFKSTRELRVAVNLCACWSMIPSIA